MILRALSVSISALILGACQHAAQAAPAVLADPSDETMELFKSHLAAAMGQAKIALGPGDPTTQSVISVLPPQLGEHETRSPAMPTQFRLIMMSDVCYAEREDTGARIELTDVPCRIL